MRPGGGEKGCEPGETCSCSPFRNALAVERLDELNQIAILEEAGCAHVAPDSLTSRGILNGGAWQTFTQWTAQRHEKGTCTCQVMLTIHGGEIMGAVSIAVGVCSATINSSKCHAGCVYRVAFR